MDDFLGILQTLTLEQPLPLGGMFALMAVVLWVSARSHKSRKMAAVAATLGALAAGVFILASAVTTTREAVTRRTNDLLQAAVHPVRMSAIRQSLSPHAQLLGPDGDVWLEMGELPAEIDSALERWPVRRMAVRDMEVKVRGDVADVVLQLSTRTQDDNFPAGTATRWRLQWQRDAAGQWKVQTIQWLLWMNQQPSRNMWQ